MIEFSFEKVVDYQQWRGVETDVFTRLDNKSLFSLLTEKDFYERIIYPNCIIGAFVDCILVGYIIYKIPDEKERIEFDLAENEDAVLLDGLAVKAEYRGKGLQVQLMKLVEDKALTDRKYCIVASVHPQNRYCLNNFLAQHYHICCEKDLSYGHRYIVKKILH